MGKRISSARDLATHPRLLDLVASAAISWWASRLVVLEVSDLDQEQAEHVVGVVCTRITERRESGRRAWTSAEVGRAARIARRRMCGEADRPARQRAFAERRVQVFGGTQGMARLAADLDETDAHRIHRRLSAIAQGLNDDTEARSCDQIRADAFVDALLGTPGSASASPGAILPNAAGGELTTDSLEWKQALGPARSRPEIQVIVSMATLLGLSQDPADIPGLGPVPAETARQLAADGRWRVWITNSVGTVTATGTTTYSPSAALARLVRAREASCRMPGCRRPADRCDLDHTVPYPTGPTTSQNLGPLCRRHHVMKTHTGWQLTPQQHTPLPPPLPEPPALASPGRNRRAELAAPPAPGWQWRTPAGFTITDHCEPLLE